MIILDDTYTFKDFGLIELQGHEHPMTPNVEQKTLAIPGRPGLWHFGTENREKQFSVSLGLIEYDKYEKQRKLNALVAFLHDAYGQPREIKWVYDYEPDKFYTVKLAEQINPERLIHAARFTLAFVAYDPFKYASANAYDPTTDYLYGQIDTEISEYFYDNPQSFQWNYSRQYSGIYNHSTLNTDFIIEISGTVTSPSITNMVNNQKLTLPSIANGKLEITSKTFEVIKDGISTLLDTNGNFFFIQPGKVGFLFEGINPHATVTYKWLHKFM